MGAIRLSTRNDADEVDKAQEVEFIGIHNYRLERTEPNFFDPLGSSL
jgi:hypothetical protein